MILALYVLLHHEMCIFGCYIMAPCIPRHGDNFVQSYQLSRWAVFFFFFLRSSMIGRGERRTKKTPRYNKTSKYLSSRARRSFFWLRVFMIDDWFVSIQWSCGAACYLSDPVGVKIHLFVFKMYRFSNADGISSLVPNIQQQRVLRVWKILYSPLF